MSRPLIVVPLTESDDLSYTTGLYGYLTQPMSWQLRIRAHSGEDSERSYAAALMMTEAL